MDGRQWFSGIKPPARRTEADVHSTKQDAGACVCSAPSSCCVGGGPLLAACALCLLLGAVCAVVSVLYANETNRKWANDKSRSSALASLHKTNAQLKTENQVLDEQRSHLDRINRVLNRTGAELRARNLDLTSRSAELTERVRNLTREQVQLRRDHQDLLQVSSDQEDQRTNLSRTLTRLLGAAARLQDERRRLAEASCALSERVDRAERQNQDLLGVNLALRQQVQNLSRTLGAGPQPDQVQRLQAAAVASLREQNQNLSSLLEHERRRGAELERRQDARVNRTEAELRAANQALASLERYCPLVHQESTERLCKKCPDGWKHFSTSCYYFSSRTLTWTSGRSWCRTQGGDLLRVDTEAEQRFVSDSSRTLDPSRTRLWIGLTDQDQEGTWLWADGTRLSTDLQFWLSRAGGGVEPDDWKQVDPEGEDCAHLDPSEEPLGSWMDGSCRTWYRWICEKKLF